MAEYRRVLVILNPVSGRKSGGSHTESIREGLGEVQFEIREWQGGDGPAEWTASAADEGFDLIIAAGGDGTACAVADGLARVGSHVPMAIYPVGSMNFLAGELGYPDDTEEIIPWILRQDVVDCDIGYLEECDRFFLISVSGGLHADIVEDTPRQSKRYLGWLAYAYHSIPILFYGKWYRLWVRIDGKSYSWKSNAMIILNMASSLPGTESLPGRVCSNDGKLDLLVNRKGSFFDLVKLYIGKLLKRKFPLHRLAWDQGREMTIDSKPPMQLQMDGESIGKTPVTIKILPGAVKMVAVSLGSA
ncbi:MAG: diacylglycerol kinase family lipid kinase [Candidatus Aegiribacteria sp.]